MLLILFVGGLLLGACMLELVHCWIYNGSIGRDKNKHKRKHKH
jgi:hypothetical protein